MWGTARPLAVADADPNHPMDWPRLDEGNQSVEWPDRHVPLRPKAFEVLQLLLANPDRIVTKSEILDAVWPDTHVTDAVLTVTIGQLREALGDDAKQARFIETLHRRGYRWIGTLPSVRATAATANATPASAEVESELPSVIGRSGPLMMLEQAFGRALAGQRQLVFVAGDAGVGKTTVVDAFSASVRQSRTDAWIGTGQCIDTYGAGEPYMPILEAIERFASGPGGADLVDGLRHHAPTWLVQLPGLIPDDEMQALRATLAVSSGKRMIRELLHTGEVMSATRPMILIIEDVHWADSATMAFLAAFAARREPLRSLIVATLRVDDALARKHPVAALMRDLETKRRAVTVQLAGLDAAEVSEFIAARFQPHDFADDLAVALCRQTGGNPLFLVSALDEFVLRGWLRQVEGRWQCAVPIDEIRTAVPDGTQAMIETRLERLEPEDLELLEIASVIGSTFPSQVLAFLCDRGLSNVEEQCLRLARTRQFLGRGTPVTWPDGSVGLEFTFSHALYPHVLRTRVSLARRQVLHRQIAACLEAGYGTAASEIAAQLAHHYESGGDAANAVRHYRQASHLASARYAVRDAIAHLRRGLALLATLPPTPESRAEELTMLGALITAFYSEERPDPDEVAATADRIQFLAGSGVATIEVFQALVAQMVCHAAMAELPRAQSVADQILQRAPELEGWGDIIARASCLGKGSYEYLRGDLETGLQTLTRAFGVSLLAPLVVVEPSIGARADAAICHCLLGRPRHAVEVLREAFRLAEAAGHPATWAYIASAALRLGLLLGNRHLVEAMTRTIAGVAEQSGISRWHGLAQIGDGWTKHRDGDPDGVAILGAGRRQLAAIGYLLYHPLYQAAEAASRVERGDAAGARTVVAEALALIDTTDERWCLPELLRIDALAILGSDTGGGHAAPRRRRAIEQEAADRLRLAASTARAHGMAFWQHRIAETIDRFGRQHAVGAAAENHLDALYADYPEMLDLAEVQAAVDLLPTLGPLA